MRTSNSCWRCALGLLVICLLLSGCTQAETETAEPIDTPTISPYFAPLATSTLSATTDQAAPTVAFALGASATPQPTGTSQIVSAATSGPLATSTPVPDLTREEVIYDDALAAGWSTTYSKNIILSLEDQRNVHSGTMSAAATPLQDYGMFFFTVRSDAETSYPTEQVVGVRFWLSGGPDVIASSDLAVTIVGSDVLPYYSPDDESVTMGESDVFSETRLYDLGINNLIPAETWVEISVDLDDLLYDPDYTFVTGVYIKNAADFAQTYFVDHVALVLVKDEQ